MKGVLFSESPVIFPLIIWKSVKERSLSSSKCLTQSKEEKNDAASGKRHFPVTSACSQRPPSSLLARELGYTLC